MLAILYRRLDPLARSLLKGAKNVGQAISSTLETGEYAHI